MGNAPVAKLKVPRRIRKIIPASTTISFDSVKDLKGAKYLVNAWDTPVTKSKSLELMVKTVGAATRDNVGSRLGTLPLGVETTVSGSDTILEITNPNAFSITVEAFRFATA